MVSADAWKYANTSFNPDDMGTRLGSAMHSGGHSLWLKEPDILLQRGLEPRPSPSSVTVHKVGVGGGPLLNIGCRDLDRLIKISPDFYTLKKRAANLITFKQLFAAKVKKKFFAKPYIVNNASTDAVYLYMTFNGPFFPAHFAASSCCYVQPNICQRVALFNTIQCQAEA